MRAFGQKRTHHGSLVGKTISMNYNRGDNIFYQGKHYIYTSSVPSNDIIYNPDGDGYTEFEDLLNAGAIVEAPLYIDTRGGGGSATGNQIYSIVQIKILSLVRSITLTQVLCEPIVLREGLFGPFPRR